MTGGPQYLALAEIFDAPPTGGHVVWLHEVARRLGGVRLLTGKRKGQPDHSIFDGVEIHRIALRRWAMLRPESLPLYANLFAHTLQQCLSIRPKAILSARILPEGLVANAVGRLLGVPSAVFAHGEELHRMQPGRRLGNRRRMTAAAKRRLLWSAFARADLVIANSRFTARLLRSALPKAHVAVVHPGTDPARYTPMPSDPALAKRFGVEGRRVILSLGRIVVRKGQDIVIRAMPEILRHVPEAVYVIAGKGNCESEFRRLAEETGVAERVRFLGPVPHELMARLYNLADVFIMANRQMAGSGDLEGFGIVFLEAGACEVPVVGGDSGGVPDAIRHGQTGLLVDSESPRAVAEAVVRLLTQPELARRMGRAARERVCRHLTWAHSAERIRSLLERCVAEKARTVALPESIREARER